MHKRLLALLLAMPSVSVADYVAGVRAYIGGDYATAMREWRPLAEQGDRAAQYKLGQLYFRGKGVEQDYAAAARWHLLAAGQGDVTSMKLLAEDYTLGRGLPQDLAEAARWHQRLAELGQDKAMATLGQMHADGRGVPRDLVAAHMWMNLAANGKIPGAKGQRDEIARELTDEQIREAWRKARAWYASYRK